jgi:hypothetical protein
MTRIEFDNDGNGTWLVAQCDFEDAGPFETRAEAAKRKAELEEENPEIDFRLMEC